MNRLAFVLTLLALPAHAQSPQVETLKAQQAVGQEWQAIQAAQTTLAATLPHLGTAIQAVLDENIKLQKALGDVEASRAALAKYWTDWCGDKPGCDLKP